MIQDALLAWYKIHQRKLPWRENHDPYRIWLSEIMLQQTQVATVIDYFNRFIEKYPTVYDLAKAKEDHVLNLWEGLGYYSRARRLIPCAKMIVENFGGSFPKTVEQMLSLPGVGTYTAGAVLSIAYNIKAPAVDGNVMRVYSRVFMMADDLSQSKSKKVFEDKVIKTLPEDVRHYNQSLMELGARICTPKPKCYECPIRTFCLAYANDVVMKYPVKSKKTKKKKKNMTVCLIEKEGYILIEKRPTSGLLAGMWGLPTFEETVEAGLDDYNLQVTDYQEIFTDKHVFTHLVWHMTLYRVHVESMERTDYPFTQWIKKEALEDYPLPTAFKKLFKKL